MVGESLNMFTELCTCTCNYQETPGYSTLDAFEVHVHVL